MMFIRKLDDLNRIVLPSEVSDFGWGEGTELHVMLSYNGVITLREKEPHCRFCGVTHEPLFNIRRFSICRKCADIVSKVAQQV